MSESESVLIDHFNVKQITMNNNFNIKLKEDQTKREYWHKFIIENGAFLDEDRVLLSILNFISPLYLVPVKYTKLEKDSCFLGRRCSDIIFKLCQSGLKIPFSSGQNVAEEESFYISIQVFSMKTAELNINIQPILKKCLGKRLESSDVGEINLSKFHDEPELRALTFCTLSCNKNLAYVLKLLITIESMKSSRKTKINLSNNNLKDLDSLELLKDLGDIKCLNLSNNEIDSTNRLVVIGRSLPLLEEIILSGNPLCSSFPSAVKYIQAILASLPRITKLDGISINGGLPNHCLWLCNSEGENLVNQFIKHYFLLYDSDRWLLDRVYHQSALFSIMCNEVEESLKLADLKLECYQRGSRNILKADRSVYGIGQIYQSREEIYNFLLNLPPTTHDSNSFKIDLIYHQNETAVIMVSGVFKDFHEEHEEYRFRSFNRTFVLCKLSQDGYSIINDLYQVTHASKDEVENSFSATNHLKGKKRKKFVGTIEERKHMVEFLRELTNMNEKFSRRCLQDVNWDIEKALKAYSDLRKNLKVPTEAFYD